MIAEVFLPNPAAAVEDPDISGDKSAANGDGNGKGKGKRVDMLADYSEGRQGKFTNLLFCYVSSNKGNEGLSSESEDDAAVYAL